MINKYNLKGKDIAGKPEAMNVGCVETRRRFLHGRV